MAGFVTLADNSTWSTSNWVYWGLMDHIISQFLSNEIIKTSLEQCKWMQGINFQTMARECPETSDLIYQAHYNVVSESASGTLPCVVEGRVLGEESQQQFSEAAQDLMHFLREHTSSSNRLS